MRQVGIVLMVVLYVSCSDGQGYTPAETSPDFRRYHWAVVTDVYAPVYTQPAGNSTPITLLRKGDVLPVENMRMSLVRYGGRSGRWYLVNVPETSDGWIFDASFTGFYLQNQADRYSGQLLE